MSPSEEEAEGYQDGRSALLQHLSESRIAMKPDGTEQYAVAVPGPLF